MSHHSTILKTIYFVRHGQSEHNAAPIFQSPDCALSEKGFRQAEAVAFRLAKLNCTKLISSPWLRAKQTAEIITATTGLQPTYSEAFVERKKPSYVNGKPYTDEKAQSIAGEWRATLFEETDERIADGENYRDLMARVDKALEEIAACEEESIIVVSHGFFLRCIFARILLGENINGTLLKNFQYAAEMKNTSISVMHYHEQSDGKRSWRFWIYNDHAHLD